MNADDQDTSSSSTSEKKYRTLKLSNTSSSTNTGEQQPLVASYHSISMILIILLLYTINILQEFFILFDYFNTKKYYWCLFSVLFLTISQFFIIICIHLNNGDSKEITAAYEVISNNRNNFIREPFNFNFIHNGYDFAYKKYTIILRKCFLMPLIFIPGVLTAIVYIEFIRYMINFKRLSYSNHFKSELSLSFYLLISSLFHSLPLAIINSCYLATKFSFVTFSFSMEMLTLNPVLTEKREALVVLVSIFISITVGICLFTSYYHLMKHIHDTNSIVITKIGQNCEKTKQRRFLFSCFTISFIHFCYKFCFITSRLVIIAVLWFLVNEKIFILLFIHLFIGYLLCNFKYHHSNSNNSLLNGKDLLKFKLKQHVSCFLISFLSLTDTFVDIIDRFQYFYNIHLYYLIYFFQNISIILIWFYKVMINMQQIQNQFFDQELYIVNKELKRELLVSDDWLSNSIQTIYAIIFFSLIICMLIVGTILRYILTNMSQKLFRRITAHNMV